MSGKRDQAANLPYPAMTRGNERLRVLIQQEKVKNSMRFRSLTIGLTTVAIVTASMTPAVASVSTASTAVPASMAAAAPMIVGGTQAPVAYSGAGSLQLLDHGDPDWHTCGVTLISSTLAVTAAHCVTDEPGAADARTFSPAGKANLAALRQLVADTDVTAGRDNPALYHVRLGSTDRLHGGVVRGLRAIVVNPSWAWGQPDKEGWIGDIALLVLNAPVTTVRPAILWPARIHATVREIGWGVTDPNPDPAPMPAPEYLRQDDTHVVPAQQCAAAGIGAAELCLGIPRDGGGSCAGDSGSGALQQAGGTWVLVGSTSRGPEANCGTVNVYTAIWPYVPWILKIAVQQTPTGRVSTRAAPISQQQD